VFDKGASPIRILPRDGDLITLIGRAAKELKVEVKAK
jgi:hypothetical protein